MKWMHLECLDCGYQGETNEWKAEHRSRKWFFGLFTENWTVYPCPNCGCPYSKELGCIADDGDR